MNTFQIVKPTPYFGIFHPKDLIDLTKDKDMFPMNDAVNDAEVANILAHVETNANIQPPPQFADNSDALLDSALSVITDNSVPVSTDAITDVPLVSDTTPPLLDLDDSLVKSEPEEYIRELFNEHTFPVVEDDAADPLDYTDIVNNAQFHKVLIKRRVKSLPRSMRRHLVHRYHKLLNTAKNDLLAKHRGIATPGPSDDEYAEDPYIPLEALPEEPMQDHPKAAQAEAEPFIPSSLARYAQTALTKATSDDSGIEHTDFEGSGIIGDTVNYVLQNAGTVLTQTMVTILRQNLPSLALTYVTGGIPKLIALITSLLFTNYSAPQLTHVPSTSEVVDSTVSSASPYIDAQRNLLDALFPTSEVGPVVPASSSSLFDKVVGAAGPALAAAASATAPALASVAMENVLNRFISPNRMAPVNSTQTVPQTLPSTLRLNSNTSAVAAAPGGQPPNNSNTELIVGDDKTPDIVITYPQAIPQPTSTTSAVGFPSTESAPSTDRVSTDRVPHAMPDVSTPTASAEASPPHMSPNMDVDGQRSYLAYLLGVPAAALGAYGLANYLTDKVKGTSSEKHPSDATINIAINNTNSSLGRTTTTTRHLALKGRKVIGAHTKRRVVSHPKSTQGTTKRRRKSKPKVSGKVSKKKALKRPSPTLETRLAKCRKLIALHS